MRTSRRRKILASCHGAFRAALDAKIRWVEWKLERSKRTQFEKGQSVSKSSLESSQCCFAHWRLSYCLFRLVSILGLFDECVAWRRSNLTGGRPFLMPMIRLPTTRFVLMTRAGPNWHRLRSAGVSLVPRRHPGLAEALTSQVGQGNCWRGHNHEGD